MCATQLSVKSSSAEFDQVTMTVLLTATCFTRAKLRGGGPPFTGRRASRSFAGEGGGAGSRPSFRGDEKLGF